MTTIVAIDLGTSKICALAVDARTLDVLAMRSARNQADVADLPAGHHEQDPDRIVGTALELVRDLLSDQAVDTGLVAAIGISAQMHGVVLADAELRAITNLITWRDQRTSAGIDELVERLGPGLPPRTGALMRTGYGGATLRWLAGNASIPPGAVALSIGDYLAARLTGVAAIDPTQAASWGILDLVRRQWDARAVEQLGIPRAVLPSVLPTGRALGPLLGERAAELGLGAAVTVASPVGDNQAGVVGASDPGREAITVNLGTGGQVSIPRADMEYCPPLETRPMPLSGFVLVGASLCGGWAYAYLGKFFRSVAREIAGVTLSEEQVYERMNALAAEAGQGAGGLRADTRFSGTRADPTIRGAVGGIDTANLTPGALGRAVLEGEVRELADMVASVDTADFDHVVATGNAVRRNPLVKSLIERAFALPCHLSSEPEEAAVGAARIAATGLELS